MKRRLKNDNGYSLVELIIVIAIIAVLSGMAAFTLSAIKTAKATAALESFDTELSALATRTKAQSGDNAIMIKRVDDGYEVYYGKSSDGTEDKWTQTSTKAELTMTDVDIYYNKPGGTAEKLTSNKIIKFKKADGSVVTGAGLYEFKKGGTSDAVGRVTLNASTGSHYFGK